MYMSGSLISFDRFNDTGETQKKALANAANGGPNSGFEIEGIDFFKDPKLADEFPEMKDEIDLIVSTESFVAQLVDFRHRIHANKGMSRGMAHELLELIPSLESHTTVRHFTEELSSIGVEMSLEAIDVKLWAIIGAAIAFVIGLIYKFISWLGFGGGQSGGTGDLSEVEDGIKEADKQVAKQEKAIHETAKLLNQIGHEEIEVPIPDKTKIHEVESSDLPDPLKQEVIKASSRLGSRLGEPIETKPMVKVKLRDVLNDLEGGAAVYNYIREPNKWARIIYSDRNPALNLIIASFEAFQTGAALVNDNLQLMEEVIGQLEEMDRNAQSDEESKKLDNISLGMRSGSTLATMHEVLNAEQEFKVAGTTYPSMAHWAVAVKTATHSADHSRMPVDNMEDMITNHEMAMRRLSKVKFLNILVFIDALRKAEPVLKRFGKIAQQEEARERQDFNRNDPRRSERARLLMQVASTMSKNFSAMMTVYGIISKVYEEASKHGTMIVDKMRANARKIVAYYNKYGEQPPPTLETLVDRLDEEAAAMHEAEIQARMIPASAHINLRDYGGVRVTITDGSDNELAKGDLSFEEASAALREIQAANKEIKK